MTAQRNQGEVRQIMGKCAAIRGIRLRALARLGEMADRGDFNEFLSRKSPTDDAPSGAGDGG
jgi:hypothetical protein